jgi:hypothetical protein
MFEMPSSIEFELYFFWSGITQTVRFYARHQDSRIRCPVTRTALEECAGSLKPMPPAHLERVFEQHRQEIERIAAEKIRARRFQGDGSVLIRAADSVRELPDCGHKLFFMKSRVAGITS